MTMKNIVKKIGMMLLTMVIVSFFAFLAFQIIPGDPTTKLLGSDATAEAVAALRAELGLDRPFFTRYFEWMLNALRGGSLRKICACLGNSLEAPVCRMHPQIQEIRNALLENGAQGALMSGAGSAVFAIFRSFSEARKVSGLLPKHYGRSFLCTPQPENPL